MIATLLATGVAYGLVAMVGWGIGDLFAALLARRVENVRALLWVILAGVALIVGWLALTGAAVTWVAAALPIALLAGLLNTGGGVAFMQALRVGQVSIVSPIAAAYSVVLVLAAVLVLGERLTPGQALAVALVLSGSLLASTDLRALRLGRRPTLTDPGLPPAFAAMIAWGLGYLCLAVAARGTGWAATSIVAGLVEVALLTVVALATRRTVAPPRDRRALGLIVLAAAFSTAANVAYTVGVERHLAALVAPVSAAFPVVTLVLARGLLGERLERWQAVGIGLVLVGVVLVAR